PRRYPIELQFCELQGLRACNYSPNIRKCNYRARLIGAGRWQQCPRFRSGVSLSSDVPSNPSQTVFTAAQQRAGAIALVAATFFWGSGFTWAKMGGETVHRVLGLPNGSPFGPI